MARTELPPWEARSTALGSQNVLASSMRWRSAAAPRGLHLIAGADSWPDGDEAHALDADEPQYIAQIGRRHVDAAPVHSSDEIAAAGENDDGRPVLDETPITLGGTEGEGKTGLHDQVEPLLELVGHAEVPHRRGNEHPFSQREAQRHTLDDGESVTLGVIEPPAAEAAHIWPRAPRRRIRAGSRATDPEDQRPTTVASGEIAPGRPQRRRRRPSPAAANSANGRASAPMPPAALCRRLTRAP